MYQQPVGKSKNRKRNILWFNPPYSMHVKTNIGKVFMRLVEKNFPVHHKFRKLFNKNNVKVSYCCMPSMASIVHKHNSKVLNDQEVQSDKQCSCPKADKDKCPLDGKCLTSCIVYKATVDVEGQNKYYYGLTELPFKTRYGNHLFSFRHREHSTQSDLSKYIWELKDKNKEYSLKWNIEAKTSPYKSGSSRCNLCLTEKLKIAQHKNSETLLNKRAEIVSKCRHRNKFYLKNIKR